MDELASFIVRNREMYPAAALHAAHALALQVLDVFALMTSYQLTDGDARTLLLQAVKMGRAAQRKRPPRAKREAKKGGAK